MAHPEGSPTVNNLPQQQTIPVTLADLSLPSSPSATAGKPTWLEALTRNRRLLAAGVLASAALAGLAVLFLGQDLWQAEGSLLYRPAELPGYQRHIYSPPSANTVVALVKLPEHLEALVTEFNLAMTPQALGRQFQLSKAPGTEIISVALDWPEPAKGAALVNRLMELHVEYVDRLRRKKIQDHLASLEANEKELAAKLAADKKEHVQIRVSSHGDDLKLEMNRLFMELSTFEIGLHSLRNRTERYTQQIAKLDRGIKAGLAGGTSVTHSAENVEAFDSPKSSLKRMIAEEQDKRRELAKDYEAAVQEYKATEMLARANAISRTEVAKLQREVEKLREKWNNSGERIARFQDELRLLPAQQAQAQKANLESQLEETRQEEAQLEATLATKRQRYDEIKALYAREEDLAQKEKELEGDYRKVRDDLRALRQFQSSAPRECTVLTPAATSLAPVSSNRRKIGLLAFAIPLGLLVVWILGRERWAHARRPETWAEKLGLPILAGPALLEGPPASGPPCLPGPPELPRFALRIRQALADSPGIILFNSLADGPEVETLIRSVSFQLAARNHKVLILDARVSRQAAASSGATTLQDVQAAAWREGNGFHADGDGAETPGLCQYLATARREVASPPDFGAFIRPTPAPGVDCMPAGGVLPVPDFLACGAMKELIEALSAEYGHILLIGPPVSDGFVTDVLTSFANGVVIILNGTGNGHSEAVRRYVQSLRETNIPLLGTVICGQGGKA